MHMDLTLFPKLFKRLSYSAGNNRNSIHPSTHPSFHNIPAFTGRSCGYTLDVNKQRQFLQLSILMSESESDASDPGEEEPGEEPQADAEENRKPSMRKKLSWRFEVCLSASCHLLFYSSFLVIIVSLPALCLPEFLENVNFLGFVLFFSFFCDFVLLPCEFGFSGSDHCVD